MLEVKYYEPNNVILLEVFLRKSEKFITGEVLQRTGGGGEDEGLEIFFFKKKKKNKRREGDGYSGPKNITLGLTKLW